MLGLELFHHDHRLADLLQAQAGDDALDRRDGAGAILAGVDKRLKAYVSMSGRARISTWTSQYAPQENRERYTDLMSSIDPIDYIGPAAPAAIFFQNGSYEGYIPEAEARALHEAGSDPKQIKWYDSYEVLPGQAHDEAAEWLSRQLD